MLLNLFMFLVSITSIALGVHIAITKEFISRTGHIATGNFALGTGLFFIILGIVIAFFAIKSIVKCRSKN